MHLLEPLILEMVAEIKQLDLPLLETHHHVSVYLNQARLVLLELNVVLAALSRQVYVWDLGRTKRLELINYHIEPYELHLDLRVVGRLPNHHLVSLVQR